MFMDIYNLTEELGVTIDAERFRGQGQGWIEALPWGSVDDWQTVATDHRGDWIVDRKAVPFPVIPCTDVDWSNTASGLFPIVRLGRPAGEEVAS